MMVSMYMYLIEKWTYIRTCNEFKMAKLQANISVFLKRENGPIIHVIPSRGSSITVLFTVVL